MGKQLRDVYPHATKLQVFKYRVGRFIGRVVMLLAVVAVAGSMLFGAYKAGGHYNPKVVMAERVVEVEKPGEIPPVMKRIAKCESGDIHFKDGQVLMVSNTNKTVDVGRYQINSIHSKTASTLGLDLTDEKDNERFAMHLYKTQGTEPWVYSKGCWVK